MHRTDAKDYFGKSIEPLKDKRLFLFDMDGTIYLENKLFDGVKELLCRIEALGGKYLFVTNNSSRSVVDMIKRLAGMGLKTDESCFYTSTQAACDILTPKLQGKRIYAQGTESFIAELRANGLNVTEEEEEGLAAVLVGYDTELTYKKLRTTCKILTERDIPYYATNPDWVCPVEFGYAPDCGSMCFGIEKATGKAPVYIGKPQPHMILSAVQRSGFTKAQTLVLGDRLYTDIASGVNADVDTVCVLSGECTLSDIKSSDVQPAYVLENVACLLSVLR